MIVHHPLEPQEICYESDVVTFALLELRGPIQSDRLLERWGQGWSFENKKSLRVGFILIPFRRAPATVVSLVVPSQLKRTDLSISKHSFQSMWHNFRFMWFTGQSCWIYCSLVFDTPQIVDRILPPLPSVAVPLRRQFSSSFAVFSCKPCGNCLTNWCWNKSHEAGEDKELLKAGANTRLFDKVVWTC